jgi:hypothetical protein
VSRACVVISLALSACAAQSDSPVVVDDWREAGYEGFGASVAALAGPGAVDCGFINLLAETGATRARRARAVACVREAKRRGVPSKFGTVRIPIDSYVHEVYVRTAAGENWKIVFDVMIDGDAPQQWNQTCGSISVDPETLYLRDKDCVGKPDGRLVTP